MNLKLMLIYCTFDNSYVFFKYSGIGSLLKIHFNCRSFSLSLSLSFKLFFLRFIYFLAPSVAHIHSFTNYFLSPRTDLFIFTLFQYLIFTCHYCYPLQASTVFVESCTIGTFELSFFFSM